MTKDYIKLQLMMGSSSSIIKWLKEEGVITKQQVKKKLSSAVSESVLTSAVYGRDLCNESAAIDEIFKHFK